MARIGTHPCDRLVTTGQEYTLKMVTLYIIRNTRAKKKFNVNSM
jgi:hypothetical protein